MYFNKQIWESIKVIKQNENELYKKNIKLQTEIFEKVESKNLLKIEHSNFPVIKKLRTLRNRVHLQLGEHHSDNDYNNFGYEEKEMMGRILCKHPEPHILLYEYMFVTSHRHTCV